MRSSIYRLSKPAMDHLQALRDIFHAGVIAVEPSHLIRHSVQVHQNQVRVVDKTFDLKKPCYVVGFGKAVYGMASELLTILGDNLHKGVLTIPIGTLQQNKMSLTVEHMLKFGQKFEVFEGAANNQADGDSMKGAEAIASLCQGLKEDDVLFVLISGGGSALLPLPHDGINLKQKSVLAKNMFNKGATIKEVNCVRKKLSKVKGGNLALMARPAAVYSLILSDVIGDPLDTIASGPTARDLAIHCMDVIELLKGYQLYDQLPVMMKKYLAVKETDEMRAIKDEAFKKVHNFIIGSNTIACQAAEMKALELGYHSDVVSTKIEGKVPDVAEFYLEIAEYFTKINNPTVNMNRFQDLLDPMIMIEFEKMKFTKKNQPLCLIFSGEPSIVVNNPQGQGGRNMHLALEVATLINEHKGVYFISCGSDGIDGPTEAAGAIAPVGMTAEEVALAKEYLAKSDSYNFFLQKKSEYLVHTGHTGTNVMDIHIMILV